MNERFLLRSRSAALFIFYLCLCACAPSKPSVRPIVQPAPPAMPVSLSFTQISDQAVAVRLVTATRSGATTVDLRNLRTKTISSAPVETPAADGPRLVLTTPWDGEIKITALAKDGARTESVFVAVVIEPIFPSVAGGPPRILYGPHGHTSVRFTKRNTPPTGTQIFFTSPANAAAPPAGLTGDAVDIGFLPPLKKATAGVIGLSPFSPPAGARFSVNVFDPKTRQWSALRSHAGRDGTVYATGPLPGLYALAVAR